MKKSEGSEKHSEESRLERFYGEELRCAPFWIVTNEDRLKELKEYPAVKNKESNSDIWMCTKEIVYAKTDKGVELTHVLYNLDPETLELVLQPALAQVEISDDEMLSSLAWALMYQIPVYANTQAEEAELLYWYERLVSEGFKTDFDGESAHLKVTSKLASLNTGQNLMNELSSSRLTSPAEVALLKRELSRRLTELSAAQSVLNLLDKAIEELDEKLSQETRNEHSLQTCITSNPVLFGPEYKRVIPKHKLGDDYEMDYALERVTGFIDLVEIESSTLELYTRNGDPRKELVHAEQQVMDWLEWVQAHGEYARHKLAGMHRPKSFVIIGRRNSLGEIGIRKLEQRNRIYSDVLEILTYDDLLDRAKNLRSLLTAERIQI